MLFRERKGLEEEIITLTSNPLIASAAENIPVWGVLLYHHHQPFEDAEPPALAPALLDAMPPPHTLALEPV